MIADLAARVRSKLVVATLVVLWRGRVLFDALVGFLGRRRGA